MIQLKEQEDFCFSFVWTFFTVTDCWQKPSTHRDKWDDSLPLTAWTHTPAGLEKHQISTVTGREHNKLLKMAAELRLIRQRAAQIIPLKISKLCLLSFRTAFSFSLPPTSSELQRESYLIMESWNSVSVSLEQSLCFELGPVFYKTRLKIKAEKTTRHFYLLRLFISRHISSHMEPLTTESLSMSWHG